MTWNRSFARTAWVLPAALAVHVAEEAPGFAAWARRNAWTGYTQRDFRRINAAGLALTTVGTWLVARTCRRAPFLAWHTTVLSQQALWNPVFHAGTTVAYREYSPGLVTALALFPATWVALTAAAVREGRISRRAAALSALGGAAVHAAAVTQQVYGVRAADGGGPRRRRWPLVATGDTTAAGDGIHRRWARSPRPRARVFAGAALAASGAWQRDARRGAGVRVTRNGRPMTPERIEPEVALCGGNLTADFVWTDPTLERGRLTGGHRPRPRLPWAEGARHGLHGPLRRAHPPPQPRRAHTAAWRISAGGSLRSGPRTAIPRPHPATWFDAAIEKLTSSRRSSRTLRPRVTRLSKRCSREATSTSTNATPGTSIGPARTRLGDTDPADPHRSRSM